MGKAFSEFTQLDFLRGLLGILSKKNAALTLAEVDQYLTDLQVDAAGNDRGMWLRVVNNPFAPYILASCRKEKLAYFPVQFITMQKVIGKYT